MTVTDTPSHPSWLVWLLLTPAVVPFCYQIGRGLGNISLVLTLLALLAMAVRFRASAASIRWRGAGLLWLVLLASGGLSAAWSIAPAEAGSDWFRYALTGSVFFLVVVLMRRFAFDRIDGLMQLIGWVGLISFLWLLGHTALTYGTPGFQPQNHIRGLVPAYLAPFVLYLIAQRATVMLRTGLMLAYGSLLAWLLVQANSLTEVLAFAAAVLTLVLLRLGSWRMRLGLAVALLAGFVALILAFDPVGRVIAEQESSEAPQSTDWVALADKLSSQRTLIWRQALAVPPPNPWLGVGAGNVWQYPPVRMGDKGAVKHLHNLFVDMWYEIGLLGLGLFLAYAAVQFVGGGQRERDPEIRVTLLASMAAILTAGMLEQHFRSHHFALFLPYLFALQGWRAHRFEK